MQANGHNKVKAKWKYIYIHIHDFAQNGQDNREMTIRYTCQRLPWLGNCAYGNSVFPTITYCLQDCADDASATVLSVYVLATTRK